MKPVPVEVKGRRATRHPSWDNSLIKANPGLGSGEKVGEKRAFWVPCFALVPTNDRPDEEVKGLQRGRITNWWSLGFEWISWWKQWAVVAKAARSAWSEIQKKIETQLSSTNWSIFWENEKKKSSKEVRTYLLMSRSWNHQEIKIHDQSRKNWSVASIRIGKISYNPCRQLVAENTPLPVVSVRNTKQDGGWTEKACCRWNWQR